MPPDTSKREALPDQDVCADPLVRGVPTLIYDSHGYADVEAYDNARSERDRLRAELDALKANQCPNAEVCKTCPCSSEDDACFPGERLRAEVTHLKEEQVSLVGSLGDAQAEVERLREAARETLGAIEDRWDGTEKSPLWGLSDALETALETDEILAPDPEETTCCGTGSTPSSSSTTAPSS